MASLVRRTPGDETVVFVEGKWIFRGAGELGDKEVSIEAMLGASFGIFFGGFGFPG